MDRFQISNLLAPLIGGSVGALLLVILTLVCIAAVGMYLMRSGRQSTDHEERNARKLHRVTLHESADFLDLSFVVIVTLLHSVYYDPGSSLHPCRISF